MCVMAMNALYRPLTLARGENRQSAVKRAFLALALAGVAACERAKEPPPPPPTRPAATQTTAVPKPTEAQPAKPPTTPPVARDLDAIRQSGELRVLFTFNSTGYFIYRGEVMGYEYDLLNLFAHELHLRLRPVVIRDSAQLFEKLNRGEGDVVAAQLAVGAKPVDVAVTESLYSTSPVVVQRQNESPSAGTTPTVAAAEARERRETLPPMQVRARLIATPRELAGQRVHLPRNSTYRRNLLELNEELNDDIEIVEVDESSDRLIQRLAEGEISFTVAPENLAALKTGEYANLVIQPAIGPPQPVAWAVRSNAPLLLDALNRWLQAKRKAGLLAGLYKRYFLDRRGFQQRAASPYLTGETGTLSQFDDWFRQYASIPGWDWRLVAAQAFQESRFNPRAVSWAGAVGLMQIMPRTARQLKLNPRDPQQSVEAACRYLWSLDQSWKDSVADESERIKFILASYNVGLGHVQDAVRLAKKNGDDPRSWDDVAYWLIRKSKRAVYNDPVVKHGYARGTEPVAYVDAILSRWANYREFVPLSAAAADARSRRLHARAALALGGVAGVVGALAPRLHVVAFLEHGHAGAEGDVEALPVAGGVRNAREASEQALDERARLVRAGVGEQDAELLAAAAADHVVHAYVGAQKTSEQTEHAVAGGMPVPIVDVLEVIDVEGDQAVPAAAADRGFHRLQERGAGDGERQPVALDERAHGARARQAALHRGQQEIGVDGLDQIVVRAGADAVDARARRHPPGEKDDGQRGVRDGAAQRRGELDAAAVGERDVEQQQVRTEPLDYALEFGDVVRHRDLVIRALQDRGDVRGLVGVVLQAEDACGTG
jgi:membrane-bound lytic murein transglycosylase F